MERERGAREMKEGTEMENLKREER